MARPNHDDAEISAFAADEAKLGDGVQLGAFGVTERGTLKVGARRSGWPKRKEANEAAEVEAAKRFCSITENGLVKFRKPEQRSDVDVEGESADGTRKEGFQITVLYDEEFWRNVNTKNAADDELTRHDVVELIRTAVIKKKEHYSSEQRRRTFLLIDIVPGGILPQFAEDARRVLVDLLTKAAFKETWLVGSTKEQLFQLWP